MTELIVAYRDLGLGEPRPYLVLTVAGPDGTKRGAIAGLIDSGAMEQFCRRATRRLWVTRRRTSPLNRALKWEAA